MSAASLPHMHEQNAGVPISRLGRVAPKRMAGSQYALFLDASLPPPSAPEWPPVEQLAPSWREDEAALAAPPGLGDACFLCDAAIAAHPPRPWVHMPCGHHAHLTCLLPTARIACGACGPPDSAPRSEMERPERLHNVLLKCGVIEAARPSMLERVRAGPHATTLAARMRAAACTQDAVRALSAHLMQRRGVRMHELWEAGVTLSEAWHCLGIRSLEALAALGFRLEHALVYDKCVRYEDFVGLYFAADGPAEVRRLFSAADVRGFREHVAESAEAGMRRWLAVVPTGASSGLHAPGGPSQSPARV